MRGRGALCFVLLVAGCATPREAGIPGLPRLDMNPNAERVADFNGGELQEGAMSERAKQLTPAQAQAAREAISMELKWNQADRPAGCLSSPRALVVYLYEDAANIFVRPVYYAPGCPGEKQKPMDALGPHGGTPSYGFDKRGGFVGYGH